MGLKQVVAFPLPDPITFMTASTRAIFLKLQGVARTANPVLIGMPSGFEDSHACMEQSVIAVIFTDHQIGVPVIGPHFIVMMHNCFYRQRFAECFFRD